MSVVSCGQHGTAWNCMKQHENFFMLHGTAWNSMEIFSCCMELHETAWNRMEKIAWQQ
jgi:hypothetical protein